MAYSGDSITDYGRTGGQNLVSIGHVSRGRQTWAQRLSGGRAIISPLWDSGIQQTFEPLAITYGVPIGLTGDQYDLLVMMIGTNAYIAGYSTATIIAWDKNIQEQVTGAGKAILWESILPRTNETLSQTAIRRAVNAWRASQANGVNIFYLDLVPAVSLTDDGTTLPGIYAADTAPVHPNSYLSKRLGEIEAAWIIANVAPPPPNLWGYGGGAYDAAANPYGNRLTNPTFAGTTGTLNYTIGTATGSTLPTNWAASRTTTRVDTAAANGGATTNVDAAFSVPTAGTLQVDLSGAGPGAINITSNNSVVSGQTATGRYMAEVDVEWSGLVGVNSLDMFLASGQINYESKSSLGLGASTNGIDGGEAPIAGDGSATMRVAVPTGSSTLNQQNWIGFNIVADNAATTFAGRVKYSNPRVFQVPDAIYNAKFPLAATRWRITFDPDATSGKVVGLAEVAVRGSPTAPNLLLKGGAGVSGFSGATVNYKMTMAASSNTAAVANGNLQDQDLSTSWTTASGVMATGAYLQISSKPTFVINTIELTAKNDASYATDSPVSGKVQYSIDATGAIWTDWFTWTAAAWTAAGQVQTFSKPTLGS